MKNRFGYCDNCKFKDSEECHRCYRGSYYETVESDEEN